MRFRNKIGAWWRVTAMLLAAGGLVTCAQVAVTDVRPVYPAPGPYAGLADKSVAIVVYPQSGLTDEFPAAREEISEFVSREMRLHLPSARLLNYKEVTNWQDDTLNWFGLSGKDIGRHFSVDRVVAVELLEYAGRHGRAEIQGRVRAACKVYETDAAGAEPAWSGVMDVAWPVDGPVNPLETREDVVRLHALEAFAARLVECFYPRAQR